jgi:hypothetical protein
MRLALMLLAGCTIAPAGVAREGFTVTPQTCIYDLTSPVRLAGSLPTYFTPGVDCVPPEGGELFTVGFGWPGGVLRLAAPRPVGVVPLESVGLYLRTEEGWCADWRGDAVLEDSPSWSLIVDGMCADGGLRLAGKIAGGFGETPLR